MSKKSGKILEMRKEEQAKKPFLSDKAKKEIRELIAANTPAQ